MNAKVRNWFITLNNPEDIEATLATLREKTAYFIG
jgi:hypothetical protein